ncbi:hypothetical protein IW15_08100 [Chryseobacterium soli]|uniref:Uncharacterized protein n=1 Tax=Chryseobacterium soli TaxID=445961 RepID=A0A086A7T0_9FLAO|nr:hypothetical protein [Chryseobacterium soli]KFF12744.1 hypothetical protein IW15_08100 [Chryseobacterium soli]
MEEYRAKRDNPFENEGESRLDRSFRLMNSGHIEIMHDEGSGGGLMYGGFGRAIKALGAIEESGSSIYLSYFLQRVNLTLQ